MSIEPVALTHVDVAVSHTLNEAVGQWIAELDTAHRTKESYRKGIRRYVSYLHAQRLRGDQRTDILAYKAHLMRNYSANTVSSYLVPVRRFYTWLSAMGAGPNVAAGIRGAKLSRGFKKDYLTLPQVQRVLHIHSSGKSLRHLRNNAIITLMVHTGLRTIEVARANVEDLHPSGRASVLDIQGKGRSSKDDFVVIPASVEDKIRTYLSRRGEISDGEPLFASISPRNKGDRMTTRSISRITKDTLRQAGYDSPRLTAHSMRHTAVTLALLGGATVQEAQSMARHSSITTTMVYAHNLDRIAHAAELKVEAALSAITQG